MGLSVCWRARLLPSRYHPRLGRSLALQPTDTLHRILNQRSLAEVDGSVLGRKWGCFDLFSAYRPEDGGSVVAGQRPPLLAQFGVDALLGRVPRVVLRGVPLDHGVARLRLVRECCPYWVLYPVFLSGADGTVPEPGRIRRCRAGISRIICPHGSPGL